MWETSLCSVRNIRKSWLPGYEDFVNIAEKACQNLHLVL